MRISMEEHEEEVKPDDKAGGNIWVNIFNEEKAKEFNDAVLKFSKENPRKPIVINIDSYGGYVDSLASMITVLDSIPNKKVMVATGKAMSCGAILLSHGDYRFVAPHARVMVHEVSGVAWGNVNDLKTCAKESDRINEHFMQLLAQNCGISYKDLRKLFSNERRDIYLDANQSVKFGIADKVGVPTIKKISKYEIRS